MRKFRVDYITLRKDNHTTYIVCHSHTEAIYKIMEWALNKGVVIVSIKAREEK